MSVGGLTFKLAAQKIIRRRKDDKELMEFLAILLGTDILD